MSKFWIVVISLALGLCFALAASVSAQPSQICPDGMSCVEETVIVLPVVCTWCNTGKNTVSRNTMVVPTSETVATVSVVNPVVPTIVVTIVQ